jgi:acetyl-CoA acetyltransferase
VADPIHLFDCVMPCAGAEGVLVMSEARARDLGLAFVRVLAATERHNAYHDDPIMLRGGWAVDQRELWSQAGARPEQMDLVEFYDDYPVIVMMQYEDLGFCAKGEGPQFVRSHTLTRDGTLPTNTSGGQLSVGQAGAAGGYIGLVEMVRQLTDCAWGVPVARAALGLVSGFGMVTYDRCLCTGALVLARPD